MNNKTIGHTKKYLKVTKYLLNNYISLFTNLIDISIKNNTLF